MSRVKVSLAALLITTLMATAAWAVAQRLQGLTVADALDARTFQIAGTAVNATAGELNVLDLSAMGGVFKIEKIDISTTPATDTETHTAWDVPASAAILHVWIGVDTAEATGATKTLDIGTDGTGSNDPNGFCDGVSVAAAGFVKCTFAQTTGSNNNYVGAAATHTRGALLTELLIAGQDVADAGDGVAVPGIDFTSGGESLSYTAGSADWAEFTGSIYVAYIELQ